MTPFERANRAQDLLRTVGYKETLRQTGMTGGALRALFKRTDRKNPMAYAVDPSDEIPIEWDVPVSSLETTVVLPDTHAPWHDKRACGLVFDVIRALKPDCLASVGDMFDMMAVSRHDKSLDQQAAFKQEIAADNEFLDEIDALGVPRKVVTLGNHDIRVEKYVNLNAPVVDGMVTLESLLGLKRRGWEVHPYQQHFRIGKINVVHDVGNCGKNADKELGAAFESSAIQGHTHRAGITYFGNLLGETHVAATIGWLGSQYAASYMAKVKVSRDWQLSFGLIRVERDTQNSHFQLIPIIDYRCVVDGRLFTA